jgi:hypothetical protein
MFSIRKVRTKSGSIAIQVVRYVGHSSRVYKHIGIAKNDDEVDVLKATAKRWIEDQTAQSSLFPVQRQKILQVERGECVNVTHCFAWNFFMNCAKECGLNGYPALLLDLAIMRLIEPSSKLRAISLLSQYFGISYSERIYKNIPKLIVHKSAIEQSAFQLAYKKFKESFCFVLYFGCSGLQKKTLSITETKQLLLCKAVKIQYI